MSRNYSSLFRSAALVLASVIASAAPSWAVVTFTNFGAGDTFNANFVRIHNNRWYGMPFVATTTGTLDSVRLPIFNGVTPTVPLVITLRAPGAAPTGTILESWTITPAMLGSYPGALTTLLSVTHPLLTAGTQYWLRLESAQPDSDPYYEWHTINGGGFPSVSNNQGATWSPDDTNTPAFEVNVTPLAPAPAFQVRYFSNLAIPGGDSVINLTNDGAASTGNDMAAMGQAQTGNLCVHVYAYTPDEQLASCCSCLVTPNGLNSLSVKNDLASNPLTPVIPSSLVVKLIAAPPQAGACNPWKPIAGAAAGEAGATAAIAQLAPNGLLAWGTTIHQSVVAGTYDVTETPFSNGKLSPTEYDRMTQLCGFNKANGSGYGICKSCKLGGLGAAAK